MRRAALLLPLLALGAGATALAQGGPSPGAEPDVTSREVFKLTAGCRPSDDRVTIRVQPSGTLLASVRVHVAGKEVVRLTGVEGPASATVAIGRGKTRVTATGDTLGGQALYRTKIYGRCGTRRALRDEPPVVGGGED